MIAVDPGRLRHLIHLRRPGTRTPDGGGGYRRKYRPVVGGPVRAEVKPIEGTERLRAMQTTGQATHRITMRYRSDVTADYQVVHEGRTFKLVAPPIDIEERHQWMELLAREET